MQTGNSKPVTSTQQGCHPDLLLRVERHRKHPFRKPVAPFNQAAFDTATEWLNTQAKPLILDSGCGVGDSTRWLAEHFPHHAVLGLDRSEDRLHRQRPALPDNARLLRTDLVDFWRLAAAADWRPTHHFLFYPNPYPKAAQLSRRFHAHPVFPALISLGGQLEARSNWRIYLDELQASLRHYGIDSRITEIDPEQPAVSAFEQKYRASGQTLWQLVSLCGHVPDAVQSTLHADASAQ